jgi:hypothetical protein
MDEYISREATIKAFCEKCSGYYDGHCIHRGECDVDVIQTAPAADVIPVKHGRWLDIGTVYTCSECNSSVPKNIFVIGCDFEGCPYCFAKMDR